MTFFQTVFVSDSHDAASKFSKEDTVNSNYIDFNQISSDVVLSHLASLDVTKSTGPDKLSSILALHYKATHAAVVSS